MCCCVSVSLSVFWSIALCVVCCCSGALCCVLCECELECVLEHCHSGPCSTPLLPPPCHWLLTPALLLLHHHSTTQHPPPSIPSKWIGKEIHIGVLSMLVSLLELTNTLNIYFLIHSMKLWYNLTHSFLWRRNKHNTIWLSFWSILWSEIVIESVCCELFTSLY